jgi:GNAT superfamily N-acetyltransferase
MEIRQAGPEHYEDYCRLIHEFDTSFAQKDPGFFRTPGNPVRTTEFYRSLFGPDRGVLMAFVQGRAVGLVNYVLQEPVDYPSMVPRQVLFITILAVTKEFTRQGIGSALMKEARAIATGWNCVAVDLCVQEYNKEALAFYAAEGYRSRDRTLTLSLGA